MTLDDWARLKVWFGEALEAGPERRAQVVTRVRTEAPALAVELESLLATHDSHSLTTIELTVRPLSAPEMFPQGLPAGALIGPYRILRELGRGGTGIVFLAEREDDEFHRPVALKLLRFGLPRGPSSAPSGLTHERGSLSRMQHGNIAILLDWGVSADGLPWMATEFVEGKPISDYCRSREMREHAILELFTQVILAVAYAHQRGVVHRDLKPGNILVNREGTVKLLDFGIAQPTAGGAENGGGLKFTPLYASPEQLAGQPATPASDVYSLAVVLGQLLSWSLPPDLTRISSRLASILRHAMASDPVRRYASVELFQADLARYKQHRPPRAFPTTWPRRTSLFLHRNRGPAAVMGLSLAAIAGIGIWFAKSASPASTEPARPLAAISFMGQPLHASAALPLRVTWPRRARVRSVSVVTQGVPNLDFTSPDASACVGDFPAGASCVMHVRFSPSARDARLGAVLFRDAAGKIINTQYIYGGGIETRAGILNPKPVRIISGLNFARGLSTDGWGNAYFIEARGNSVDEIPAGSSSRRSLARMPLIFGNGATAVDGAGNIYFSSAAGHAIYELRKGGPRPIAILPANIRLDNNLSVDGAGNLYASDDEGGIFMIAAHSHRVVRLYPGNRGHRFIGMTADLDGTLYCADYSFNQLYELVPGSSKLVRLIGPDRYLNQPHALLLLSGGVLLVGNDIPNGHILRYPLSNLRASILPALGNQSLASYDGARIFSVVNNRRIYEYVMQSAPKN